MQPEWCRLLLLVIRPVLLALCLGLIAVLARRVGTLDGLGLLGLASTGPVIIVLVLGWPRCHTPRGCRSRG